MIKYPNKNKSILLLVAMTILFLLSYTLGTFIKYYKISQLIHTQSIAN